MTASPGIWFVHRSHRDGPLGKRVRRLAVPSILAWFQAKIEEARTSIAPEDVGRLELGGRVHGLDKFFAEAKKHSVHTPKSTAALAKLVHEHLHVDHADNARVDAHSVRVVTADDEGDLAWFFFDDEALRKSPRQLAFLLHDEAKLPDGDADLAFAAASVPTLGPPGEGAGATFVCLLSSHGKQSLPGHAFLFSGVRLPDLPAHFVKVTPEIDPSPPGDRHDTWPMEMRLLRAEIADDGLAAALARAARYPLSPLARKAEHGHLGVVPHAEALAAFTAAAQGLPIDGEVGAVHAGEHAAFVAMPRPNGHQQWILFDDRWAAANAELATSLLHYAEHADPFAPLRTVAAPKVEKPKVAKTDKPKTAAKAKAEKAKADKISAKDERAWKTAIGDRDTAAASTYAPSARFTEGGIVAHTKFGVGVVTRVEGTKCEILFRDGARIMVHGATLQ
jgi:hypothetical protein